MHTHIKLAILKMGLISLFIAAAHAETKEQTRNAAVAGGETIELAAPAKDDKALAKERPEFERLIPKKRLQ